MNNKKGADGKGQALHGYIINEKIKESEFRVINQHGENLGLMPRAEALALIQNTGLDLVLISKDALGVVTAKIMDFGKFLYEKKKQQNEARRKTKTIEIKEVKLRPNIDSGDYNLKVAKIIEFICNGDHVKITLQFRGRELTLRGSYGPVLFEKVLNDVRVGAAGFSVDFQRETGSGGLWTRVMVGKKR